MSRLRTVVLVLCLFVGFAYAQTREDADPPKKEEQVKSENAPQPPTTPKRQAQSKTQETKNQNEANALKPLTLNEKLKRTSNIDLPQDI